MKKISSILLILVVTVINYSCEDTFLSPELETGINANNYFNNDAEIEAGVINIYDGIQGVNQLQITNNNLNHGVQVEFYVTEMRSDNTETKSNEGEAAQFEFFNIQSTNGIVDDYYRSYYNVIYRANLVLDNLSAATATKKLTFEGEAKFLRALAYFNLVRLFGDIPLIDKVISPTDTQTAFTRVASSQIYDLIISDLQTAITNLSAATSNDRASKAAAEGILAKVYLTLGRYSEAQTLLENIINSGAYSLETNFKDVFYNEGNNEVLFAIGFVSDTRLDSQSFSAEWLNAVGRTSGVNYASLDAKNALDMFGGNRTAFSYREDQAQAGKYQVVKYLPDGDSNLGIAPTSADPRSAGNDWVVLRYADILLMHVEAIMAGSASTTSSNAITSFQKVRDRAGLTTAVTSISEDELLLERRVELAFENQRFFDLLRFGKANEVFTAYSNNNNLGYTSTDLLLPIPQREINIGNGILTQNPGY